MNEIVDSHSPLTLCALYFPGTLFHALSSRVRAAEVPCLQHSVLFAAHPATPQVSATIESTALVRKRLDEFFHEPSFPESKFNPLTLARGCPQNFRILSIRVAPGLWSPAPLYQTPTGARSSFLHSIPSRPTGAGTFVRWRNTGRNSVSDWRT